ncbi:hypothetical protein [Alkalicoccobacillus gibsonii]|uniref:hypothetical protein n=1 Tax=Alkalicoccobacillus gibsonii TaxID=79881 RepID=UPI001933E362|nr:hypothetical protein [Alkalicoccobacillus gibsonii]MBM0065708.1 hypothetical protein [Alkalicoccobacillus gibsonii]
MKCQEENTLHQAIRQINQETQGVSKKNGRFTKRGASPTKKQGPIARRKQGAARSTPVYKEEKCADQEEQR